MTFYFCWLIIYLLLLYIEFNSSHYTIRLSAYREAKWPHGLQQFAFASAILILLFVLVFKSSHVGFDTDNYYKMYNGLAGEYVDRDYDWGIWDQFLYYWIFDFLYSHNINFNTAKAIIYIFAVLAIYLMIKHHSPTKILPLIFFLCLAGIGMYMSGLRQIMAITLGLFAFHTQLRNGKLLNHMLALALVFAAILIHKSAVVLLCAWILNIKALKKKSLLYFAPIFWFICLFMPTSLLNNFTSLLSFDTYTDLIGQSSSVVLLLVYVSIGITVLFMGFKTNLFESTKDRKLLSLFILCVALMILSAKFYLVSRLSYFFHIPFHIVLSMVMERFRQSKDLRIAYPSVLLLIFVFFYFALSSDDTGIVPYSFMWEYGEPW